MLIKIFIKKSVWQAGKPPFGFINFDLKRRMGRIENSETLPLGSGNTINIF
jgi:hypothetical protein